MIKYRFRFLFLSAAVGFGSLNAMDTFIEAKGAFYYPTSSIFREIYSYGEMFGAEASFRTLGQLYTWTSGSFFIKTGHSIGLHDSTRIAFYPIGLGFKYIFPMKSMDFYLGAGGLGAYMHIHDHSSGVIQKTCRWGGGGIVKGGLILNSFHRFFFDLFTDYSFLYVPVANHRGLTTRTANLSSWSIGLGIGYRFGAKNKKCTQLTEEQYIPQAEEPDSTVIEPTSITEEPVSTVIIPSSNLDMPKVEEPDSTFIEPTSITEEPDSTVIEPASITEEPVSTVKATIVLPLTIAKRPLCDINLNL